MSVPSVNDRQAGGQHPNTCAAYLSASRTVARRNGGPTDRGFATFDHGGDWIEVRDGSDKIVWYGQAHCKFCARAEAIMALEAQS